MIGPTRPLNVLVIEDDVEDYQIVDDLLREHSRGAFNLEWAGDFDSGLKALLTREFDACLVDYHLHGDSGLELVRRAREADIDLAIVFLTGDHSGRLAEAAQAAGVDDFVSKNALTADLLERTLQYTIERRRVYTSLRESEAKYRSLFNGSPIPTWVMDAERRTILAVNDAAVLQYGYARDEFIGMPVANLQQATDEPTATFSAVFEFANSLHFRHRRKNGTVFDVEVLHQQVSFNGQLAFVTLARDITESLRAHRALVQSEERFRELADNIPVAFFIADAATNQGLYLSPGFERVLDIPVAEAMARPRAWLDRVHPDDRPAVLAQLNESRVGELEFRIVRRDGGTRWIRRRGQALHDSSGRVLRIIGTAEDITDLRRAQQRAETTSKMEAVGRLAGGVAHDFNNILTAILGEADLLKADLPPDDARRTGVDEIISSGLRAADLTRQLLAFGRQQMFRLEVLDLNVLVAGIEKMLRRVIGEDVRLRMRDAGAIVPVLADASQIEQIVMNLAVNARDAMPGGGQLSITTDNVDVSPETAALHDGLRPGRYVTLKVIDTGVGIPDHIKERIFEPFFTTKELGHGTGLGLATVYGIVKQSNGYISVEGTPGGGTTFTVYFPRASGPVNVRAEQRFSDIPRHGSEAILVVEDEDAVRAIVARILHRHGYTVLEASSGAEAAEICDSYRGAIDLVLCDIVMPDMTGPQAVAAVRLARPGIKTLYMSGYTDREIVRELRISGRDEYLQKPFTPQRLLEQVRQALEPLAQAI